MQEWNPNICNETSGFLFSHKCDRLPVGVCSQCQRPICNDHTHGGADAMGSVVCTTCRKQQRKISRKSRQGRRYDDNDFFDDPYFYGPRYGGHRGYYPGVDRLHDPHDFTEADSESLHFVGDDEFEQDMTES